MGTEPLLAAALPAAGLLALALVVGLLVAGVVVLLRRLGRRLLWLTLAGVAAWLALSVWLAR